MAELKSLIVDNRDVMAELDELNSKFEDLPFDGVNLKGKINSEYDSTTSSHRSQFRLIPHTYSSSFENPVTNDTNSYLKNMLKWICRIYPNDAEVIYLGIGNPNSKGIVLFNIYNNSDLIDDLPRYSSGIYIQWNSTVMCFGTNGGVYYYKQ